MATVVYCVVGFIVFLFLLASVIVWGVDYFMNDDDDIDYY